MKKWLSALCALTLALSLAACGGSGGAGSPTGPGGQEAEEPKTTSASGDVVSAEVQIGRASCRERV